jgi:CBS domain-containing protein
MRVRDLRVFDDGASLITVAGNVTVEEAAKTMAQARIGAVLVVADERVAGIFTERDIMNKVVAGGRDAKSTPVADVMTVDVKTVQIDDAAIDCLETMADGKFRHLPVIDAEGRPIGMLSQRDFVATTLPQALSLARETARATVSKRYQPFAIAASVVAYTLVIIAAVSLIG